uniref:Uncharacterized protein n=1 Tax=viral metagenome TaxID=1070528 RepID=A0A6C0C227_9ZZZZ
MHCCAGQSSDTFCPGKLDAIALAKHSLPEDSLRDQTCFTSTEECYNTRNELACLTASSICGRPVDHTNFAK